MSLVILSKSPVFRFNSLEMYKNCAKKILGRVRGPMAVTASLLRGLDDLGIAYKFNPKVHDIGTSDIVWTNDTFEGFEWALTARRSNAIKGLFVGPSVGADYETSLQLYDEPEIDILIQPSRWVLDFLVSRNPDLESKIRIWPAGVPVYKLENTGKRSGVMIFCKKPDDASLLPVITGALEGLGIKYQILHYGKFRQGEYHAALNRVKGMVYLSNSESQGLALQEAWMHDVPTIVWNRGFMEHNGFTWQDDKISAPYLDARAGVFFKSSQDFSDAFGDFWKNIETFDPRGFAITNLSDKVCAEKFLSLFNEYEKNTG